MNFKQLILEELNGVYVKVYSIATDGWNMKSTNSTIYKANINDVSALVEINNEDDRVLGIRLSDNSSWGNVGNFYKIFHIPDHISFPGVNNIVKEAILNWKFKQKLNPNTAETFGDLIDEL